MANTLVNSTWITKDVARGFVNEVVFLDHVDRTYDDSYKVAGAKVGDTVHARLPQQFVATDGQALQLQALYDQTVPISLTNQKNIAFSWSSREATVQLDEIKERYTQPAAETLANAADVLAMANVYRDVFNAVGSPGTTPSATLTYLQAGVKLTDGSVQMKGRVAVLDPMAMITIANATTTLFNPSAKISENYSSGQFGRDQLGISWWGQDVNRPVHTTGTFTASTPLMLGAGQTGSTISTDGWASGASSLKKGDVFTIGGVYSVNAVSKVSTGRLQQFVVTSDSSGAMATLPISPSIITSGALQTVSGAPGNDAVITVLGATSATAGTLTATASPQSFVYHPDAFAFVMADLKKPSAGAESAVARSKKFGFNIRLVEQYQIGTDQNPSRLDILIGAATIQPRLACRVWG
jgi:hypothetical protein